VLGLNRGAKNPGARLTEETAARGIALIRSGMTQHAVAKILGVSRSTISHAYYGITWKHLSSPGQPPCVSL
jgi:DNA invertase Pin-like site-specific DNA recombinase